MIALLQRVSEARVDVNGKTVGQIGKGLLVFIGIEKEDTEQKADQLLDRILNYRIFSDSEGKMNLSLKDIDGELLLVSQFTLVADTNKGKRPSFSKGADPETGRKLFHYLLDTAKVKHTKTESGIFAADMQVSLVNDGPVTFWLQT